MNKNSKLDPTKLQTGVLKRYLQFSPEEEKLLAQLRRKLAPEVAKFVDGFYKHLLRFQKTKELLNQPGIIERLKKTQTQYFLSLFDGDYSRSYFEQRLKIGLTHERIGLSPQWLASIPSSSLRAMHPKPRWSLTWR